MTYEIKFIDSKFGYDMTLCYKTLLNYIINCIPNIKYLILNDECDLSNEKDFISTGFKILKHKSDWTFFDNKSRTRIRPLELEKINNNCYYKCYSSGITKLIYNIENNNKE